MVYDEGFDIIIGNQSYFAFSMYSPQGRMSGVPGGKKKWDSKCYATLNGWYHIGNKWGCFYAVKKVLDPYRITNGEVNGKNIVLEGVIKSQDDSNFTDAPDGPVYINNLYKYIENININYRSRKDMIYSRS